MPIDEEPSRDGQPRARIYERGDPRASSVKDDLSLESSERRLARTIGPRRLWLLAAGLALLGYVLLATIAYGRWGAFEVAHSFDVGNADAAAVRFCALMAFFGVWVGGAQRTNLRLAICLCVAALVFTVQIAIEYFHVYELLPLALYALDLGYCVVDLRRRR